MPISYRIKRLMLICCACIVLIIVATNNSPVSSKPAYIPPSPAPSIPLDIDPNALEDVSVDSQTQNLTQNDPSPRPSVKSTPRPEISAEAYLVANLDTGEVYFERNTHHVFPIASLSKLITSLVALHKMDPTENITITESMLEAYGDAGHLVEGETFTLSELFYPLLLESSNDTAEAIAQSYGYKDFIQEMNNFVHEIGMKSTSFHDASGLSPGNVSNADDLLRLARYIYSNEKPLLELTRQTIHTVASTSSHFEHTWKTINPFPFDPHFIGGKTGRTIEAKESMVSMFKYVSHGKTYPVVIIVLRSEFSDREEDTSLLFRKFMQAVDSSA